VEYKANSSFTWTNAATATTATAVSLSGLTAATLYDWRVNTNCSSSSSLNRSAQFTTATGRASILDTSTNGTTVITGKVQKVAVFPNPANKVVNINLTGFTGKSDVSLFDVNGRVVLHREVSTINSQLDIAALPAGVYMLRIKNGIKEVNMTKIIKQ
jgi:hypothetical protein